MSSNNSFSNKLNMDGPYLLQWGLNTSVRSRTVLNHSITCQNGCKTNLQTCQNVFDVSHGFV